MDETLVKGDVINQASRILLVEGKINKIYTNRDVISWNLDGIPSIVKDKTFELFGNPIYAVLKKKPISGVEIFLNYLKLKDNELHILTARPKNCWKETTLFINKIFGENLFDSINCVDGCHSSKLPALAKINPDYYFDDNIGFCEEARKVGIKTYLVCNEYTPWNHKMIHEDIKRIKNVAFFPFSKID